jgi:hypothetical protein
MKIKKFIFALIGSSLLLGTAEAVITITIEQQGSNVVASYSGSWDSWTKTNDAVSTSQYIAGPTAFQNLQGAQDQMSNADLNLTTGTWVNSTSPPPYTPASSFTGDVFGFTGPSAFAPIGYVAGQSIAGSLTFDNTDVVTMGFTPGESGVFSGGGNTVNYSVVPEPSQYAFLAGVATLTMLVMRRRLRRDLESVDQ